MATNPHPQAVRHTPQNVKTSLSTALHTDDEIRDVLSQMVSARVGTLVKEAEKSHFPDDWSLLRDHVDHRVTEALRRQRTNHFVYLTPEEWLAWYNQVFSTLIGIATLGAGFTFTVIFAPPDDPQNGTKEHVRRWLIISWLLFLASLGSASFAVLFVNVNKSLLLQQLASKRKWYTRGLLGILTVLVLVEELLPVAAIAASMVAVKAYDEELGWVGFALVIGVGCCMIVSWTFQNSQKLRLLIRIERRNNPDRGDDATLKSKVETRGSDRSQSPEIHHHDNIAEHTGRGTKAPGVLYSPTDSGLAPARN